MGILFVAITFPDIKIREVSSGWNQCVEKILIDREHRFWKNRKVFTMKPE
jgi:hypothetical protein